MGLLESLLKMLRKETCKSSIRPKIKCLKELILIARNRKDFNLVDNFFFFEVGMIPDTDEQAEKVLWKLNVSF